jgi:hypothetical protein
MSNIEKQIEDIKTKQDFLRFIDLLINDYRENQEKWENQSVEDFLDAMCRWTESIEAYYKNNEVSGVDLTAVTWRVFADILIAPKYYE